MDLAGVAVGPYSTYSPRRDPRLWLAVGEEEAAAEAEAAGAEGPDGLHGFHRLPFSVRNALLLEAIPKFCECWGPQRARRGPLGVMHAWPLPGCRLLSLLSSLPPAALPRCMPACYLHAPPSRLYSMG